MYNIAIAIYAFFVRLISPFHKKAKLMIQGQKQTFDILRQKMESGQKYIWFHASSLGEFEQGRPMMERIKRDHPEYKILLTFFSPSGYEIRKNYPHADVVCYLPFDTPGNAKQFLKIAHPFIAIFIKYEFWMNYLTQLKKRGIPTYIISSVFRPDQIFFKPYASNYKHVLTAFDIFFVQDESSKNLLNNHEFKNVIVSGDTRFDRVGEVYNQAKSIPLIESFCKDKSGKNGFTLIAGSSWEKDEDIFIPFFNENLGVKLIIAPHEIHQEHLDSIISKLSRPFTLFSQATEDNIKDVDCVIIDSFGLLSSVYRYGNVAYIGGGFGVGIHNILEAAVYGIPVVFGPNYHKFIEAKELIKVEGGFSIKNKEEFTTLMNKFMSDKDALTSTGKKAGDFVQRNIGTTDRILKEIGLE